MNNKKVISLLTIFTIILTVIGGSLAYWTWDTTAEQQTNVVFTTEKNFTCAVDGGGNITSSGVKLAPTTCTDTARAIKREIKVTPTIKKDNLTINMDLWLDVNSIGTGLSESVNFNYVLTTSSTSCEEGTILSSGTFNGTTTGSRVDIMNKKAYTETTTETYYLYIWLDTAETSSSTMNQTFNLSLNASCTDYQFDPEKPDLDEGMIPVTISANGVVTTIDEDDDSWYNYDKKEWANVVLVSDSSRSNYLNTTGVTVTESDILAYYVWIPRYSYIIPRKKCSSIPTTDRNMEDYPECYAPYTMTDSDKSKLVSYWASEYSTDNTDALNAVNYALEKGKFPYDDTLSITITGWVDGYNNGYVMFGDYEPEGTINITASQFNGNKVLLGDSNEVSIDIMFETKTAPMSMGNTITTYRTHPAFWWDDDSDGVVDAGEMVAGIWVGKFETTGNATTPTVKPNTASLRTQNVSTQFATSQKFTASSNTYGLSNTSTNAHMMKNSEYGAVAYLSHSKYGINQEIYINNSSDKITGRSGGNIGGSVKGLSTQFPGEQTATTKYNKYGYYTWIGQSVSSSGVAGEISDATLGTYASTTGNVTGVYDLSGGSVEYVMGNHADNIDSSGFSKMPDKKYYDFYSAQQFNGAYIGNTAACTLETCGGHALIETANWHEDNATFVFSGGPWFMRGGSYDYGMLAGAFSFDWGTGGAGTGSSWRSVLVVGYGT